MPLDREAENLAQGEKWAKIQTKPEICGSEWGTSKKTILDLGGQIDGWEFQLLVSATQVLEKTLLMFKS